MIAEHIGENKSEGVIQGIKNQIRDLSNEKPQTSKTTGLNTSPTINEELDFKPTEPTPLNVKQMVEIRKLINSTLRRNKNFDFNNIGALKDINSYIDNQIENALVSNSQNDLFNEFTTINAKYADFIQLKNTKLYKDIFNENYNTDTKLGANLLKWSKTDQKLSDTIIGRLDERMQDKTQAYILSSAIQKHIEDTKSGGLFVDFLELKNTLAKLEPKITHPNLKQHIKVLQEMAELFYNDSNIIKAVKEVNIALPNAGNGLTTDVLVRFHTSTVSRLYKTIQRFLPTIAGRNAAFMHHLSKAMSMSRTPKDLVFQLINDPSTPTTLLKELKPSIESLSTRMAKGVDKLVETSQTQDKQNFVNMIESSTKHEKDIDDNTKNKKALGEIQTSRTSDKDSFKSTDQTTPSNTQEIPSNSREIHPTTRGDNGEFGRIHTSDEITTHIQTDSTNKADTTRPIDSTSLSSSSREDGERQLHQGGSHSRSLRQSRLTGRGRRGIANEEVSSTNNIINKSDNNTLKINPHSNTLKLNPSQATLEIESIIANNEDVNPFMKILDPILSQPSISDQTQKHIISFENNKKIPSLSEAFKLIEKMDIVLLELTKNNNKLKTHLNIQLLQAKKLVFQHLKNIPQDVLAKELELLDSEIAFIQSNIKPMKEFGTNYPEYYHNPLGAINRLLKEKHGQVAGAFYKEGLGDIDLVYGEITSKNKGYGLAHILDKHPELDINKLPEIVEKGEISARNAQDGFNIEYLDYILGINKGWNKNGVKEGSNNWVVTAFDKNGATTKTAPADSFAKEATLSKTPTPIIPQNSPKEPTTLEELKQIKKELEEKRSKLSEEEQPKDLPINTMIHNTSKAVNKVFKKPRYQDQNMHVSSPEELNKLREDLNNNLLDEKLAKDLEPIFKELQEKFVQHQKQYRDWLKKDEPLSTMIGEIHDKIQAFNPPLPQEIKTTYEQDLIDYPQAIKALEEFEKTKPKDYHKDITKDTLNKLNDLEDTNLYKNKKDIQKALSFIESKKLAINKLSPSEIQKLNTQEQIIKQYEEKNIQNKQVLDTYNKQRRELLNNYYLVSNRLYNKINDKDFLPHLNPKQKFNPKHKLFSNNSKLLRIYFDLGKSEADMIKKEAKDSSQEALRESAEKLSNLRDKLNEVLDIKPMKEFGTNYVEFYHDGPNAMKKLLLEKHGQVTRAFYKEGLGDIDLVWGNKDMGLAHILDKHPEVIDKIPEIIERGKVVIKPHSATKIVQDNFMVILKSNINGKSVDNKWILTAYEDTRGGNKRIDSVPQNSEELHSKTSNPIIPQTNKKMNVQEASSDKTLSTHATRNELQTSKPQTIIKHTTKTAPTDSFTQEVDSSKNPKEVLTQFDEKLPQLFDTQVHSEKDFEMKLLDTSEQSKPKKTPFDGIDTYIDDKEFERLNNVSQFDIAKVYKSEYNNAIDTIINSTLLDEKKAYYLKKYKDLFIDKLGARSEFVPPNVAGFSRYKPNTKATERLSIKQNQINELFEKIDKDIESSNIFKNIQDSELNYYKDHNIVVSLGHTKDLQPRINISFITKPRQQIIYALKTKGFVYNSVQGVWSTKVQRALQNKEWLENRLPELLGLDKKIDLSRIDINDILNKTKNLQAQRKQEQKNIANALRTDSRLKELYTQKKAIIEKYGGQDAWGQFPWGNHANANEEQHKVYKKLDDINDKIFSRKEELHNQIKAQQNSQNTIESNPYIGASILGAMSGGEIDYNQDGKNTELDVMIGALSAIVGFKGLKYLSKKPEIFKNVLKHYFRDKGNIIQEGFTKQIQKERRGIYNVAYNGKMATLIKKDLSDIESGIMFEKGKENKKLKQSKGYGAKHITARHSNPKDLGYVTQNELLNLGQSMREYIKEYKEPFIENSGARIYEWKDKDGVRFRLVVGNRSKSSKDATTEVASKDLSSLDNRIITFYSDRNLKQKMQFKNPKLQSLVTKLKNKLAS